MAEDEHPAGSVENDRQAVEGAWRQVADLAGVGTAGEVSWGEPADRGTTDARMVREYIEKLGGER